MSGALLELKDVRAGYGGGDIVRGVSFCVERGEIFAIVGESGCGKSTTLKAIAGLPSGGVRVTGGDIIFEGRSMPGLAAEERRRLLGEELCMVFQDPASSMNPIRKIKKQFLETIRSHRKTGRAEALAMISAAFSKLGLEDSERILDSCPFELSGGMCQRVALALALVMEPKLILADEVTSALDVVSQLQVADELTLLRDRCGASVVLVTHNMAIAARVADRLAIMLDGRIVECGETRRVLGAPEHEYTKKLIADVPRLRDCFDRPPEKDIILRAENVSRRYEGKARTVLAVDDVSFTLSKGEALGIVGESGSGKSTLARQLLRLEKPDGGSISLDGADILPLRGRGLRSLYRREQMVFQTPAASFDPRKRIRTSLRDTVKNLTDKKTPAEADAYIDGLMRQVGLEPELADRYPFQLSGGQCQRAAIARAIAPKPEVLICDEATSALDVTVQARITELLRELVDRLDMSMVFISHDIALVSRICDTVLVMKDGKCVEYGPASDVVRSPRSEYTKSLLDAAGLL